MPLLHPDKINLNVTITNTIFSPDCLVVVCPPGITYKDLHGLASAFLSGSVLGFQPYLISVSFY